MEPKKQSAQKWIVPALLVVIIALLAALLLMRSCQPEQADNADNATPKLAYAEGVVGLDEAGLQAAVDAALAEQGRIALEYKNEAVSSDGTNFTCHIANANRNAYDMYIQIFADAELTDQLYLSGLVKPGNRFQEITLDHSLDTGTHRVYVVYTQVEDDLETIHGQVTHTMDFIVQE